MDGETKPVTQGGALAALAPRDEGWGALVERTARGDMNAFAAFYDATAALVHGLALRILGDPGAAEEVTADVFLQVWRQAGRYDAARGAPLAWLLTLTRSRAIDRRRARAAESPDVGPLREALHVASAEPGPEESAALAERRRVVRAALGRLTTEQRRAIELSYLCGLSHTEIAGILGESLGTVKTRIRLGMMRLRETLARTGKDTL
jgi:RNA polymerase sigma-70 factor (ECF subfamily)